MMNEILLRGQIKNIQHSHYIGDVEYEKAELVTVTGNDKSDIINLKFKKFSNPYRDGEEISIKGNIRSYSKHLDTGKNKVEIYVFTYFDPSLEGSNEFTLTGRICKIDPLATLYNGKHYIHFLLANNIITDAKAQKINNYLPCVAWGQTAKQIASYKVNDAVKIKGSLHSRQYKKQLSEEEFEYRVAHELLVTDCELLDGANI